MAACLSTRFTVHGADHSVTDNIDTILFYDIVNIVNILYSYPSILNMASNCSNNISTLKVSPINRMSCLSTNVNAICLILQQSRLYGL